MNKRGRPPKPESERIIGTSVGLDAENLEWLEQVSSDTGTSMSEIVREALTTYREHLERQGEADGA